MNKWLIGLLGLAGVIAIALVVGTQIKRSIETEVTITASPDAVWRVLTDREAYGEWNPFIVSSTGDLVEGQRITNVMRPDPESEMAFDPVLLVVDPPRELRWLGRLGVPGLFDGEHYFLLEETATGTRLVHGENFSGFLLLFIDVSQYTVNFEAMNAALATRAQGTAA